MVPIPRGPGSTPDEFFSFAESWERASHVRVGGFAAPDARFAPAVQAVKSPLWPRLKCWGFFWMRQPAAGFADASDFELAVSLN